MDEITSMEVEALTYTYGEESLKVLHKDPLCIKINVAPHTGEVATEQYVNATLFVTTSGAYPDEAPIMQLQNPQGMSDYRIGKVIAQLSAEANSLLGEMMLGCLIETAKDTMTAINQPEGHCIFCLEDLLLEGATPSQETLQRLPCYHCYHLQCFAEWWHWQQSDKQQKAIQMKEDLQSAAPHRLQQEGLVPDPDGFFAVSCPICRLVFSPGDVPHVRHCTQRAHEHSQAQQPITHPSSGFTPIELHKLALAKQKRAKQFAQQQQQGGIVSERYGTSIAVLPEQAQQAAAAQDSLQQHRQHPQSQQRPQQQSQQRPQQQSQQRPNQQHRQRPQQERHQQQQIGSGLEASISEQPDHVQSTMQAQECTDYDKAQRGRGKRSGKGRSSGGRGFKPREQTGQSS